LLLCREEEKERETEAKKMHEAFIRKKDATRIRLPDDPSLLKVP
jgi:hypothetical protein